MAVALRASVAASLLATLLTTLVAQQPPTIHVPVRLVAVPTLVLSQQGRVIDGLTSNNFHLYDNQRLQNVKLELGSLPLSVVLAIQANNDVRHYLPFIAQIGTVVETMLVAETGEAAVITYNDDVTVSKPFASGEVEAVFRKLSPSGQPARMIDAGLKAISLLKDQPGARSRVLLFIGQPADHGSHAALSFLQQRAESENVSIYALTLPLFGKSFVSDSFHLSGLGSQGSKGGYRASVELTKLLPALKRSAKAATTSDPFSLLTSATGGVQLHFRKLDQLENALLLIGQELRSLYVLTYSPDSLTPGDHKITIQVDLPGAKVFSRPGYAVPTK